MTELWTGASDKPPLPRTLEVDLRSSLQRARAELSVAREHARSLREACRESSVDAELWSGPAKHGGAPLTCLYVGQRQNDTYLRSLLFADTATAPSDLGSCSTWAMRSLIRAHEKSADLVIVEVGSPYAWLLPRGYLVMPGWVKQALVVDDDWQSNLAKMTADGRSTITRITRHGLKARLLPGDLHIADRFYDELYVPHATARFGPSASLDGRDIVRSMCRRFGLFEITRDGVPLAGAIMRSKGHILHGLWDGFRTGLDATLMSTVTASVYYFNLLFAYERGFRRLDLGGTRGFLNDGVLRYKRKWGATLVPSDHPGRIGFRVNQWSSGIAEFFAKNPVLLQKQGAFSARLLTRGARVEVDQLQKVLREQSAPGLQRLEVFAEGGFSLAARKFAEQKPELVLRDLSTESDAGRAYCAA